MVRLVINSGLPQIAQFLEKFTAGHIFACDHSFSLETDRHRWLINENFNLTYVFVNYNVYIRKGEQKTKITSKNVTCCIYFRLSITTFFEKIPQVTRNFDSLWKSSRKIGPISGHILFTVFPIFLGYLCVYKFNY